jgi:hypothetical protein
MAAREWAHRVKWIIRQRQPREAQDCYGQALAVDPCRAPCPFCSLAHSHGADSARPGWTGASLPYCLVLPCCVW